jgi:hypothetical protein
MSKDKTDSVAMIAFHYLATWYNRPSATPPSIKVLTKAVLRQTDHYICLMQGKHLHQTVEVVNIAEQTPVCVQCFVAQCVAHFRNSRNGNGIIPVSFAKHQKRVHETTLTPVEPILTTSSVSEFKRRQHKNIKREPDD